MRKFVFVVLLVFLLCGLASAGWRVTTLSDMQMGVRQYLSTSADPYHPNDTLTNFINRACDEVATYGVIQALDTVTVASGNIRLTLNEDCLNVFAALPCTASGQAKYDKIYPLLRLNGFNDWNRIMAATEETQSKYYVFQPAFVSDSSGGVSAGAAIWLCPEWALGDDSIWVFYYKQANKLVTANDTTAIPYEYISLVEYYATALALASSKNYNEAAWWFAQYDRARQEKGLLMQIAPDFIVKPKVIE